MKIILIIAGILTALCLVMAAVSGEFSLSKEEKERIERELERKREIKRERKRARKQRSNNEVWPWWLN